MGNHLSRKKRPEVRERLAISLLVAASFVLSGAASADTTSGSDPNDTASRLDIARVIHGHASMKGEELLTLRINTYERWRTRLLRSGINAIYISFSTDDDRSRERYMRIDFSGGRLRATMHRASDGERIDNARLKRASRRSVTVLFPKRLLGTAIDRYVSRPLTIFHANNDGPCGTEGDVGRICSDRSNRMTHLLSSS